jgi:Phosphotransferase enzyme family
VTDVAPPVPSTLDEVFDTEWLTAALGPRFPGIKVTGVEQGPVVSRVATNASFKVECDGPIPREISTGLWVKGYFTDVGTPVRILGAIEAAFYRDLAESTAVRTLQCVYADAAQGSGVIITADVLGPGGRFLSPTDPYTTDQVAESLEQLAVLHASTWMNPTMARRWWLDSRLPLYTVGRGLSEIAVNFDGPIGSGVPAPVRDAERLHSAHAQIANLVDHVDEWCVIHGDCHIGNLFVDSAGQPGLVDWQLVQRGPWYLDVGYHIASTLPVEVRRSFEGDLLDHYLDRLIGAGVDLPQKEMASRDITLGMITGFYLWAITLHVEPSVTAELLRRLGAAVDDHDAFADSRLLGNEVSR